MPDACACRAAPTQGLVEGGARDRPAWLNMAVHVVNSVVAWMDLLIGERAPHARAMG